MEEENARLKIIIAAIAKRYGPLDLYPEDITDNEDGFAMWYSADGRKLVIESWDDNESKDQATE